MSSTADDPQRDELPKRWWHWRRLLRGRVRPVLAAGLAGVLLGVGGTAWRTQTGPFASDEMCWGALSRDDLAPLFREPEGVRAVEAPVLHGDPLSGPVGNCLLTNSDGDGWALTARVHRLDSEGGYDGTWADQFLAARLTPLGGGLLGMAADNRAWLALPDDCLGRPDDFDGPTVVDIAQGRWISDEAPRAEQRDAMARMVVKLVNEVSADLGCAGTIADPVERLPEAAQHTTTEEPDALCGIPGLSLGGKRTPYGSALITSGRGPVRTCDRDIAGSRPRQRLMTVEDPRLAAVFMRTALHTGDRVRSPVGLGGIGPNLGVFRTQCPAGPTVFLVQAHDAETSADLRTLFPRYVEAEAARLGCGPLKLTLPRPGGGR
ncbi:hypothetical protein [Streptomyces flavalbus]|uniref:Uncharacterized protein n=1 Tax=Streptomyces flavalbus TaxID=2665155 RepID=A0ABW2W143_9ACTN